MEEYEKIAEGLIAQTSSATLPAELKLQLRDQIVQQLHHRVGTAILGQLSEDAAKHYLDLMAQKASSAQLEAFFTEALPTVPQVVSAAVESYIDDFFSTQQVSQ